MDMLGEKAAMAWTTTLSSPAFRFFKNRKGSEVFTGIETSGIEQVDKKNVDIVSKTPSTCDVDWAFMERRLTEIAFQMDFIRAAIQLDIK